MSRTAKNPQIPSIGQLDRSAGALGRQLTQKLRDAIQSGALKPGEPLPSTRALADSLGIARGTVVEAFEQLIAEGFLDSCPGVGTQVASSLASSQRSTARRQKGVVNGSLPLPSSAEPFIEVASQFMPLPPVPFAISVPVGMAAPGLMWRRLGNRIRAHGKGAPSGYDDPQGALPLRKAIAEYVRRSRSVYCDPEQIIVTTGTQQGLFLACLVLLGREDFAWVENPAYRGITAILDALEPKGRMVRVPVDEEGIDVEAGLRLQPDARVAFVTPSHQYPLGMPMSMARRNALLRWARARAAWVVEDDYDSEMRYTGHPFPSMQGLDPDRVVYLGTFSKILFPSLRLGYAIVPHQLVSAFCGARALLDRHPASADQHVLAAFISEGHLDRHVRRIRGVYAQCRSQLFEILQELLPSDLAWLQPSDQGMHSVLWLAPHIDDLAVASQAINAGISVRPVSPMYKEGDGRPGLILGLSAFTPKQITDATQRLVAIISEASMAASPARRSARKRTR
ncbi:TPA: PLP-dependent aminotransferase family protein [Pseudomonas aeruginosa]|uniref:MocR-like pyridoxine biosynthesis transcription factor PdxR n=1 Tax=Pseudomonas aeruginosa TaxID=287 RepID=UPI002D7BD5F3|nr:PLP-dependent aminotransferase family protein [Pseudomonas aeruginosa]HBP5129058.1 PLP-dependent aminotransferase family protein [Pseudomonas aeruginosa]HCF3014892.1 PLP-dependent aminotransferase family protein [Pseudomonas aeruginosa]HEP8971033.1 PLP-dependent aminotransferase family protein [Pseudomonas aeruginosa]